MHRAEKASSRICRDREVEKAQELHRKKIDGVKSYLTHLTRPTQHPVPPPPRKHRLAPNTSRTAVSAQPLNTPTKLLTKSAVSSRDDYSDGDANEEYGGETFVPDDNDPIAGFHDEDTVNLLLLEDHSTGKSDALRAASGLDALQSVKVAQPPPQLVRKKSLHGSFRTRRLKEIQADNAELSERLKKSTAHYRNDDMRRDWQQNVSYLQSICEFPIISDIVNDTISKHAHLNQSPIAKSPSMTYAGRRRKILKPSPTMTMDPIMPDSSLELPVIHPIKAIPTSTRRAQLNFAPGFRSLRKAMPQQPTLPPLNLAALSLNEDGCGPDSATPTPRAFNSYDSTKSLVGGSTSRASGRPELVDDGSNENARYQLLKTGRFVGGTYLVLTVFCGDGVSNPYGFDVVALQPETHAEYRLRITKEMIHELLDTTSTSSSAAVTAAAAGTNLSMEEIARTICDHINYSILEHGNGEMVFFVATYGGERERELLIDTRWTSTAFCIRLPIELLAPQGQPTVKSRRMWAYVSSSSSLTVPTGLRNHEDGSNMKQSEGASLHFQLIDEGTATIGSDVALSVEHGVHEVYRLLHMGDDIKSAACLNRASFDIVVPQAIRHLHIISAASELADDVNFELLVLHEEVNASMITSNSPPKEKKRLRNSASCLDFGRDSNMMLLQTGVLWKSAYFVARVSIEAPWMDNDPEHRHDTEDDGAFAASYYIHDIQNDLVLTVFNASSGNYAERRISPQEIDSMLEQLQTLSNVGVLETLSFIKQLLLRLSLTVDWRGQEAIVFPQLDNRLGDRSPKQRRSKSPRSPVHAASTRQLVLASDNQLGEDAAATVIQANCRGFLYRKSLVPDAPVHNYPPKPPRMAFVIVSDDYEAKEAMKERVMARTLNKAASKIQLACRYYMSRKRRNAFEAVVLEKVRTVTPTINEHFQPHSNDDDDEDEEENGNAVKHSYRLLRDTSGVDVLHAVQEDDEHDNQGDGLVVGKEESRGDYAHHDLAEQEGGKNEVIGNDNDSSLPLEQDNNDDAAYNDDDAGRPTEEEDVDEQADIDQAPVDERDDETENYELEPNEQDPDVADYYKNIEAEHQVDDSNGLDNGEEYQGRPTPHYVEGNDTPTSDTFVEPTNIEPGSSGVDSDAYEAEPFDVDDKSAVDVEVNVNCANIANESETGTALEPEHSKVNDEESSMYDESFGKAPQRPTTSLADHEDEVIAALRIAEEETTDEPNDYQDSPIAIDRDTEALESEADQYDDSHQFAAEEDTQQKNSDIPVVPVHAVVDVSEHDEHSIAPGDDDYGEASFAADNEAGKQSTADAAPPSRRGYSINGMFYLENQGLHYAIQANGNLELQPSR
ncbi:TPA: hypothetical protein N0F65_000631 [Lagenidium giganteum]|uniref:Uncharacterized protein n=1 Tax=Lagenidium giganteum TaxID=4803 RepID=A0AAV2YPH1_9STRA|nr:TPA: hypothetical protein N0F65_000631 [Lagenidium giganteum]